MNIGDKVKHKLSGELMTIRKLEDGIAVCHRDVPLPPDKYNPEPHYTAVCAVENLEVVEDRQLKLFEELKEANG